MSDTGLTGRDWAELLLVMLSAGCGVLVATQGGSGPIAAWLKEWSPMIAGVGAAATAGYGFLRQKAMRQPPPPNGDAAPEAAP